MNSTKKTKAIIIGSGFAGLSAAAYLAKSGLEVTIIEKNKQLGGRARVLHSKGFSFDMGPSWYWMPDIFDNFFNDFNKTTKSLYDLIKLNPGFRMIFEADEIDIHADFKKICTTFDKMEKNGAEKLKAFINDAEHKYNIGVNFLYNSPGVSIFELLTKELLSNITSFELLISYRKHIRKYFSHPYLINVLEFPVLFLGASADKMPALYSLMAYSALKQGTFYPCGGFNKVITSIIDICKDLGVKFITNNPVTKINIVESQAKSVKLGDGKIIKSDFVIAAADYSHVEEKLIDSKYRNYSKKYWDRKKFSPSSLIFYLGINKKLRKLIHHNLFFDENIDEFSKEIYKYKIWPNKPLFYICCPSKTDKNVAPKGQENVFILMPIPVGVKDTKLLREKYFNIIISKIEAYCEQKITSNIIFKKSYCINDFESDYNSYKGNAYGLANTLNQTANMKPKIINKKVDNLFYTGQLTVPGPGVPPSLISGKIVAEYMLKRKI